MTFVGYGLKFIPLISIVGWILDVVIAGLNFSRSGDRQALFDFILDENNYPDTAAYLKKVGEYVRDFPVTRSHDLVAGTSYMVSVFTLIPTLGILLAYVTTLGLTPAILWFFTWLPWLIFSLSLAAPSFQWLDTPLFWMPRADPDAAAADAPAE